jgi:sugar lactone lactonase YvrE
MIACIAPRADAPGEWIAGMESGLFSLRPQADGTLATTSLAPVEHAARPCASTMAAATARAASGPARCCSTWPRARASAASTATARATRRRPSQLDDLIVPNGLAFSPDGRTMYLSDSHPSVQAIWAFDYDTDSGTPGNRRLFADMKPLPGRPDGAAMDVDGCYWICGNDAGLVHRFTPDGRLDRSLEVPVKKPAMCAFGGPARHAVRHLDPPRRHRPVGPAAGRRRVRAAARHHRAWRNRRSAAEF